MIKIGFICEGFTERNLLNSTGFQKFLTSINLQSAEVINATGAGNLLPHNIEGFIKSLEKQKAEVIFILTDLDNDVCITKTKERINAREKDIVIIAVKKIEAWFLANEPAIKLLLDYPDFSFPNPEDEAEPFETINNLMVNFTGRGVGKKTAGKIKLVNKLLEFGLDVQQSADHPNCRSAKYFIDKLTTLGLSSND